MWLDSHQVHYFLEKYTSLLEICQYYLVAFVLPDVAWTLQNWAVFLVRDCCQSNETQPPLQHRNWCALACNREHDAKPQCQEHTINFARRSPISLKKLAILATIYLEEEEKKKTNNLQLFWLVSLLHIPTWSTRNFHTMQFSAVKLKHKSFYASQCYFSPSLKKK